MRSTKKLTNLIARLGLRKASAPATRIRFRRKQKKTYILKTDQQKTALKSLRCIRRINYQAALLDARSRIKDEAQKLQDCFGGHSVEYYEKAILQHRTGLKSPRTVSPWNAYLSQEAKHLNDRELIIYNIYIYSLILTGNRTRGKRRKSKKGLRAEC